MRKLFPGLGLRTVAFTSRSGAFFEVPLLPVRDWDRYAEITAAVLETGERPAASVCAAARKSLRRLIETVWPAEHAAELLRLDYGDTLRIAGKLLLGEEEMKPGSQTRKQLVEEPDVELLAARMLSVYPGYTLEALLAEPAPIFFRLLTLSERVRADNALTIYFPAIMAALAGGDSLTRLQEQQGSYTLRPEAPPPSPTPGPTPEEREKLEREMDMILGGNYKIIGSLKPGMRKS